MADWVIAGGVIASEGEHATPEIGKTYEIRHSRKGTFTAKVLAVSGEWADVEVVSGVARAAMRYNVGEPGDKLTVRDSQTYWIPL